MTELLELHQLVDSEADAHHIRRSKTYEFVQSCYSCPFLGILLATLSSLFFSLCSVIVKELIDINPIELASFRYVQMINSGIVKCFLLLNLSFHFQIYRCIFALHTNHDIQTGRCLPGW